MEFREEDGDSAEGIKGQKSVAEICREHQISQALYYRWRAGFWRLVTSYLIEYSEELANEYAYVKADKLRQLNESEQAQAAK